MLSSTVGIVLIGAASCGGADQSPVPLRPPATEDDPAKDPPDTGRRVPEAAVVTPTPEASVEPGKDVKPTPPGEVFAHSPRTLYKLEPISKTLTKVGDFSCTGSDSGPPASVIDIAVDKNGKMFGTTFDSLIQIDRFTGQCSVVALATTDSFPNSLSFVPAGTIDAAETLVGFSIDVYVKINTATGEMTTVGNLNPNPLNIAFRSSGDIVSVDGDKTYLTAKSDDPDAGGIGDYLVEIDPATGKVKRVVTDIKKQQLYGLGYWAGTAYAFSATGESYSIDLSNGFTTTLSFPNAPTADAGGWFGAGATTKAPTMR